ncbi:MAG: hypothetical protein ACE5JK_01740 [Candidatus Omnitrophota bacterium]
MKLHKYKNYNEYLEAQKKANINKLSWVWADKKEIKCISDYIKKNIPNASFGICHGSRNGVEVKWFREFLGIEVIGTDISETAKNFPNLIQWDFHKVKDEWIDNVDFIYSNSLDHTYDPAMCLDQWMKCIKKDGLCFIEWTKGHIPSDVSDPFGATMNNYKNLIKRNYRIKNTLVLKKEQLKDSEEEEWLKKYKFFKAAGNLDKYIFVIQHRQKKQITKFLSSFLKPRRTP